MDCGGIGAAARDVIGTGRILVGRYVRGSHCRIYVLPEDLSNKLQYWIHDPVGLLVNLTKNNQWTWIPLDPMPIGYIIWYLYNFLTKYTQRYARSIYMQL